MAKKKDDLDEATAGEASAEPAVAEEEIVPVEVETEPSPEPANPTGLIRLVRGEDEVVEVSEMNWIHNRHMWEGAGYRQS